MYINGQPCGGAFFRGERIFDANPPGLESIPFYIEDVSGSDNTVQIVKTSISAPTLKIQKSTDGKTWESMGTTSNTAITATIPANGKLYLKCSANKWGNNPTYYNHITVTGDYNVGGNIMSLLYGNNFQNKVVFPNTDTNTLTSLFKNDTHLINASNLILPATTVNGNSYSYMFYGCYGLTTAPALPATTLASSCYNSMFGGCTSLTKAPDLPATTLANYCYGNMFWCCYGLTTAPALPATTLAESCYNQMFYQCVKIKYIKCLATDISASNCINNWLKTVSATGTFVKDPSMSSWPTGASGIPSGWTVEDAA